MIFIDLPELPLVRVGLLEEESRSVRGGAVSARQDHQPTSWIDLSPVTTIPLTPEMSEDKELVNFIVSERDRFRYDYVRLRCSFHPTGDEKFEKAWLEVTLSPGGPVAGDPPVAWSMAPGAQYDTVESTNSAKIGAKLKFLSSEVSESSKAGVKLYSIRSYRESTANPSWEMKTHELADIDGNFAFHLVVRSPNEVKTMGTVRLSTIIGKRMFWVIKTEQPHADEPVQDFVLPPAPTPD
jgi:hypothetical protein